MKLIFIGFVLLLTFNVKAQAKRYAIVPSIISFKDYFDINTYIEDSNCLDVLTISSDQQKIRLEIESYKSFKNLGDSLDFRINHEYEGLLYEGRELCFNVEGKGSLSDGKIIVVAFKLNGYTILGYSLYRTDIVSILRDVINDLFSGHPIEKINSEIDKIIGG